MSDLEDVRRALSVIERVAPGSCRAAGFDAAVYLCIGDTGMVVRPEPGALDMKTTDAVLRAIATIINAAPGLLAAVDAARPSEAE